MTLPAEVKKAFHISKQLFAEPGMMERVEKLQFEACRLAGKRLAHDAGASFSCWKGQQRGKGFSGRA